MDLTWNKYGDGSWCAFHGIDLNQNHFNGMEGVYVIWQNNGPVIRLGQGVIKDRVATYRSEGQITAYDNLYITWASVPVAYRDSVEKYLATRLKPRVGDAFPNANPLTVNLPWPYSG